ncbi:phosphotransferase enzyme domain protein [Candidatus Poribacteria bacterium]|nr:phosphotransferase enzyme domain protein [Candidatus Poribacteria bacterium]
MRIGIDFDNTIAQYDDVFRAIAIKEKMLKSNWFGKNKSEIRDYLRFQPAGEQTWMRLQGLVYGKHMQSAEIMPNVANFLLSCRRRKYEVFIVSHKTEYGHFDPEKIPLRSEALKWMETKGFFSTKHIGINKENVFFAKTRTEKVNIISNLKCTYFIDDLPEIFTEDQFPDQTRKILFGFYDAEYHPDKIVLNSWSEIFQRIFGEVTNEDITFWLKHFFPPIERIKKIAGGGNSDVYQIHVQGFEPLALKHYPDRLLDKRHRLETEFHTLQVLRKNGVPNVPKAVKKSKELDLGLYEWIEGDKITTPTTQDLELVILFVKQLNWVSKKIDPDVFTTASEACLSAKELVSQVDHRLERLHRIGKRKPDLKFFLEGMFCPLWNQIKDECISFWPEESRENALPLRKQILSPSDFGFHNCLMKNDGSLAFLDFEYFGWDDPVKLTADFIWHPAMHLGNSLKQKWKAATIGLYSNDLDFEKRLHASIPLYGMRWALIILNNFSPNRNRKYHCLNTDSRQKLEKMQKIQLKKAKYYCKLVKEKFRKLN